MLRRYARGQIGLAECRDIDGVRRELRLERYALVGVILPRLTRDVHVCVAGIELDTRHIRVNFDLPPRARALQRRRVRAPPPRQKPLSAS